MSRYPRLTKALLAAAAALAVAAPSPAAHAVEHSVEHSAQVPPASQHVARAVSLVGTHLRLADGETMALPRAAGPWPVLLGTVRNGWVLASGGTFRLVQPDGNVRTISERNRSDLYVTEALSGDGRRIVWESADQADAVTLQVVNLQGREVSGGWFPNLRGDVMAATTGKVYIGGNRGLSVLEEKTGDVQRVLSRPTGLVDLGHDTVFVSSRKGPWRFGPTSLSDPTNPQWRARFEPVAVSPDGRYVVGREGTVRAMKDGHVVRRVPAPQLGRDDEYRFLGWGSSRRVLLETTAGKRHFLVSCAVPRGACRQIGFTKKLVSLPTSHAGPYRQP